MKYILETTSHKLALKIIEKIRVQNKIEEENLYIFDYEESGFEQAASMYLTPDIFGRDKLIYVKSATFLSEEATKKKTQYYKNVFESKTNNIIILGIEKIKKTKTVFSKIKDEFEILNIEEPKGKELELFIEKYLSSRDIKFTKSELIEIIQSCNSNFDVIVNELTKVSLATNDISNGKWKDYIYDYSKQNVFDIVTFIYNKDYEGLSAKITKLREQGQPLYSTLSFIVSDLVLALSLKHQLEKSNNDYSKNIYELSKQTGVNSYRLNKINENTKNMDYNVLLSILREVNAIQSNFKYSEVDDSIIASKLLFIVEDKKKRG